MKRILLGIIVLTAIGHLTAQITKDSLPGNSSLPSSEEELTILASHEKGTYAYSVEDYFQKPKQSSFKFSPNGLYLSYKERDKTGKSHIYIKNVETNEVNRVLEEGKKPILLYVWGNNEKILFIQDGNGDENYHVYSVNLDGSDILDLTPFKGVTLSTVYTLKEQLDYIVVPLNKNNHEIFEPFKININTGNMELIYENKDVDNPINDYTFDKDGVLKSYIKKKGSDNVLFYRTTENSSFKEIIKTSWKDEFDILKFNYTTDNPHDAFVLSNIESNTKEIILYDFKKKETIKKVYSNETFDVTNISLSKKRGYEADYYNYTGEKSVVVPISETYKKLHRKFLAKFGGKDFEIRSKTDEEDKFLILVTADKLYGTYYLYDHKKDKFKELFNLMPNLIPKDMAEMKPVKFISRDGLTVYGYLTVPNQVKNGEKVPLIVNPHGGPYGVRDNWEFNPEAQLFASRGYATLQINYRGSGGYGKEFYLAGSKQIGRKMLDDLEDGVTYVKSLNIIDEDRIAIYGLSYGGLATLGSLVKTPDLYTCGVDYEGVSNLFTFIESFPAYWKPFMKEFYEQWYDAENEEEKEIMKNVSPALNVDKIIKPVFVIQGANDPRVNIKESDQIVQNLRNRGFDIPYMVKYNEGHGFRHEQNKIELYKTMLGFFAKYFKH